MERNCKNCGNLVYAGKAFCSDCGAKWIEKRITIRNVGADFADMYLGFDTKFARTFIDLFRKPHHVINGYIKGARMNYVDAVRYVFIAIFISGLYMFIIQTFDIDIMSGFTNNNSLYKSIGYSPEQIVEVNAQNEKMTSFITKYQGLIVFITLPILALIGRITFWNNKKYNFTEHLVMHMYTYSHFVIASTPISILLSFINVKLLMTWSALVYPIIYIYNTYCYKKCLGLNWQEVILKAIISIFLGITLFVIISISVGIIFIVFTNIFTQ